MEKSCFCKSTVDNIYSAFYVTFLVCIFNTEDKISKRRFSVVCGIREDILTGKLEKT